MSGKVVNLRRARKRKSRAENTERANANAARYGLSAEQKTLAEARAEKARRDLDGHERDPSKD